MISGKTVRRFDSFHVHFVSIKNYEHSPQGIPNGVKRPEYTHGGHIIELETYRGTFECGFMGPVRTYRYEANDDLLAHFRKMGTYVVGSWKLEVLKKNFVLELKLNYGIFGV